MDLLECEFLGRGYVQKGEIFRRRTDEDQIVVLRVIQGKEAAALDANLLLQLPESIVEGVHSQNFTYARVVIQDPRFAVACSIVVTHAGIGASHKRRIAENDQRLRVSGEKAIPESAHRNRSREGFHGRTSLRNAMRENSVNAYPQESREPYRAHNQHGNPAKGKGQG